MLSKLIEFVTKGAICGSMLVTALLLPGVTHGANAPGVTVMTPVSKGMVFPSRLALDTAGNCYVADIRGRAVLKYDTGGNLVSAMRTPLPAESVAVTADGKVLVSQQDSVAIFDGAGNEIGRLGKGAGQFEMANGMAVDGSGQIYVVDSRTNSVQVFTPSGSYIASFGSYGTAVGQLSSPTGIAYEKISNQIAVADSLNGRVQFFDTFGVHRKTIGGSMSSSVRFTSPQGIAFEYTDGPSPALKRMYVVDTFQNVVQALDPSDNGTFLAYVGEYGAANGKLMHPSDAVFDQTGSRLIVANGKGNLTMYGIDPGAPPVDTTPPTLSITRISAESDVGFQTIGGTVEAGAGVSVKVNTGALAGPVTHGSPTSWQCTITGLIPGDNVISVTASDVSGNSLTQTTVITYRLPPPALAINRTPALTGAIDMVVTGTVDAGSTVTVSNAGTGTNGAATVSGTSWSCPVRLAQGTNTILVTAQKPYSADASDSRIITLDNIPPALTVSALPDNSHTGTQIQNITGSVFDSNLSGVSINGQPVPVLNGTFSSAVSLNLGNNIITVKSTDLADNSTTDTRTIYFDTAIPVITITNPADGLRTNKNIVTLRGQVNKEAVVTAGGIQALMNGTRWNATVTLSEGLNTVEVIADDPGGNRSSLKRTIFLDFDSPEVYIANPAQDLATNKSSLIFMGAVAGTSKVALNYSINGNEAVPVKVTKGRYRFHINFPSNGVYRVAVTAVDAAGNAYSTIRTVIHDTTAPELTIAATEVPVSSTLNGTVETGATVTVADRNGAAGTVTVSNNVWIAELASGYDPASLTVTATDAAGNKQSLTVFSNTSR